MIKIQGEEFNCDILIQFSVLQKVIFKLASTVDSLTEKVDVLENNLVSKSKKIGELEKKLNINLQNHENRIKNLENKQSSLKSDNNNNNIQNSDININPNVKQLKTSLDNKKENVDNMLIETNLNNKENEDDINKNLQTTKPNNNNDLLASNLSEANEEKNEENNNEVIENSEENQNNNDEEDNNNLLNQNNNEDDDDNNNNNKNVQIKSTTNTKSIITNKYIIESDNKYLPKDKTSPELLSMLFKKYSDLEKKVNNFMSKNELSKLKTLLNDNSSKIENIEKNNNDFNNNLSEMDNKLSEMKRSYDEIKVKVEDFNIYELFKDNGDGNLDASKILIQALENKVFKKFGLIEDRIKINETDIFNIKNNLTNYDNLIESIKRENEKIKKLFEE
jgi:hypothetical protein